MQKIVFRKISLFLLLASLACNTAAQAILVVGDSISAAYNIPVEAGWVNLLAQKLARQQEGDAHRVINASISGDTTAGGLARLPRLLKQFTPDIVVLELGGNDGLRGLPLRQMQSNLERMIEQSRAAGAEVLLIGVELPRSYGKVFNRQFQQVYQSLAERTNTPLIFLDFDLLGDPGLLQEDGLHPTAAAQPLLVEHIWPHIVAWL